MRTLASNIKKSFNINHENQYHFIILLLALFIIIFSFLLRIRESHIALPIVNYEFGSTCLFKLITRYNCPMCGMTRSFVSISHYDFTSALHYNLGSFLLYSICVLNIPYRIAMIKGFNVLKYKAVRYLVYASFILTLFAVSINFVIQFL